MNDADVQSFLFGRFRARNARGANLVQLASDASVMGHFPVVLRERLRTAGDFRSPSYALTDVLEHYDAHDVRLLRSTRLFAAIAELGVRVGTVFDRPDLEIGYRLGVEEDRYFHTFSLSQALVQGADYQWLRDEPEAERLRLAATRS